MIKLSQLFQNHDASAAVGDPLHGWAADERVPVLLSDKSPTGEFILAMLQKRPIQFVYWGGSASGEQRSVLVTEVFQIQQDGPVYAEGYCLRRRAERVFRLDRVDLKGRHSFVEERVVN